ncbi:uncharacterized protein LOC118748150 [Rhagoletis pomonella]|uniref:uncharacterized protein LOC118748150 n=1 Tax=Rhagoletis pomonella TaxID=28610 RepID=UPI00177F7250|nr:uncharacterized protein LOC118748150 [Rhagoletis pomonella]
MASSNVNTGFAKCFIAFMAIVILLQGCIYLALALYGITRESCQTEGATDVSKNPFDFVMKLVYFQSESCGNPKITASSLSQEIEIQMNWSKSFDITNRTYIFLITYAAVSALWIVTSLLVLASVCGPVTKLVAAISFWPWFSIVIGGCILDGVATGYHIYDLIHTTTVEDTFTYIGADTTNDDLMAILENFDAYFVTPAIVMTGLSSRLVLIWLLNIFGTGFCLSLSHVLAKNISVSMTAECVSEVSGERRNSGAANFGNTGVHNNSRLPVELSKQAHPQALPNEVLRSLNTSPEYSTSPAPVIVRRLSTGSTTNDVGQEKPSQSNITYRNTDTHPDRLDYPGTKSGPVSPISPPGEIQQLSIETPLNSRYTNADVSQLSNHRVTAELRSQLPWSYTNMLGNPQVPPKPQKPQYPEIPVPDYTT